MAKTLHKILLAEDNNRHYVNFVQATSGLYPALDVMRVENGYDLLNMMETNIQPDAIFLDIDMPYKGGLQILEEIKARQYTNHCPVVILSGSAYDLTVKVAFELGAILFVRKFDRVEDLRHSLQKTFDSPYFAAAQQAPWNEFLI